MKKKLIYAVILSLTLFWSPETAVRAAAPRFGVSRDDAFRASAPDSLEAAKLKKKIEWVMQKVDAQPDWLYSRLQMFWESHAEDVLINGEYFDRPGGGRAPEPTVKYNGSRSIGSEYTRPSLENIVPYDDDSEGRVTYVSKVSGQMEKTHLSKTGCNVAGVNRQIMGIARDAAKIYAATGDLRYGKAAAKVFDVYMKGIYYRNVPTDLNFGHQQTLVGMTTFEVIHEDIINELTQTYPLIRRLLSAEDRDIAEAALKKWAENIIANGVPHNNWDMFQADFIVKIALVLQDDGAYADSRGRRHYLDSVVNGDSIRQWSIPKLIGFGFDPRSKTWYESPGYSVTMVGGLCEFADMLDAKAGIDLFERCPVLIDAVRTLPQYLFPNRMIAGWGDTHPDFLPSAAFDAVISYARRHGNAALEAEMSELKSAVRPDALPEEIEKYVSGTFYAPNVSWMVLRTGMDLRHDLMASLNASLGNHQHANGISLELYGKGYVLAPDAGIGRTLYSGLDYAEYYSRMPAHNTVVVDGISDYPAMMSNHAFSLVASSPELSEGSPSAGLSSGESPLRYATVKFLEPETGAEQQRSVAVVKTSETGGYYVDVFRSRKIGGGDKTHDYFYHNLGQEMQLADSSGAPLAMQPTEELAFAGGHLGAYSYLYDKKKAPMDSAIKTRFITTVGDSAAAERLGGTRSIVMTAWMRGDAGRTVYRALSPVNLEYERMPYQPYKVDSQPVLTLVARQSGEAWDRPFVSVFEPSSEGEPGEISAVGFFEPLESGATGVEVRLKDGRIQRLVCSENGKVRLSESASAEDDLLRKKENSEILLSPDGRNILTLHRDELKYTFLRDGKTVVRSGGLGMEVKNFLVEKAMGIPADTARSWMDGMEIIGIDRRSVDGIWTPVYGERSEIRDRFNEMTVHLRRDGDDGGMSGGYDRRRQYFLDVIFRVYDEGIALRYHFPEGTNGLFLHITDDLTSFRFESGAVAWHYAWAQSGAEKVKLLKSEKAWAAEAERPLTLRLANGLYAALGEASLSDFVRGKLKLAGDDAVRFSLYETADVIPPFSSPWRYLLVGEKATDLVNGKDMVLNLNEPCRITDCSWIRPGKAFRVCRLDMDSALEAVDFCVDRGMQFIELDAGWYGPEMQTVSSALAVSESCDIDMPELCRYARSKGIGVWLYVNQRALSRELDSILPLYEEWGVSGIKFGFVQVGSQKWTQWLHDAVRKCAEHHIMVDIHDEYRPTGWSRTWPNLMTQEGVGGNEEMPDAEHDTVLPFTRFLCGPADYTPCYFNSRVKNTKAHQLAMSVVYYSPVTFLYWYDRPSDYRGEGELDFWKHCPTVWDESIALDGEIGEFIVQARRSGQDWFVGVMNGLEGREISLDTARFLEKGAKYSLEIHNDDPSLGTRTCVSVTNCTVKAGKTLKLKLQPSGGAALRFVRL